MKTDLTKLSKDQLISLLEAKYIEGKPHQDAMVDISTDVILMTAEVYRRGITAFLPGVPINDVRLVTGLECSINHNKGLPELSRRIEKFKEEGVVITRVDFDTVVPTYRFYADSGTLKQNKHRTK